MWFLLWRFGLKLSIRAHIYGLDILPPNDVTHHSNPKRYLNLRKQVVWDKSVKIRPAVSSNHDFALDVYTLRRCRRVAVCRCVAVC